MNTEHRAPCVDGNVCGESAHCPPADMSMNVNIGPMSLHDAIDYDVNYWTRVDYLLVRARCCRDWPVLAATRIGRCGYCGQVPVVIGPWL